MGEDLDREEAGLEEAYECSEISVYAGDDDLLLLSSLASSCTDAWLSSAALL